MEERVLPAAWFRVGVRGPAPVQAQYFWLGLGFERGEVLTVGHLKRRLVDGRTAPRPLPRTHKHGGARRDAARIVRERRCAHAVLGGYPATAALGLLTLCLGLYSARRPELGDVDHEMHHNRQQQLIGVGVLFAIGVLNGSLTSGTGLFVTLWLVRWFGLSYPRAVAHTLILVGLAWNGTGALVLGFSGEIRWSWVPALVVGSLIGGYLGAHLSLSKGSRLVKRAFELLSLLMGVSLLIRSL